MLGPFSAVVDRVIDGDTVVLYVDLGFRVYTLIHIRIARIDAPEVYGEEAERGEAAAAFLHNLLPPDLGCTFYSYGDERSFNRYIADIETADGIDVAQAMLEAGHAVPYEED